ncbi:Uncharacterised protein [Bordetella pertussis]|nr:Uncharacterised protein [Bordetella pertussis]CFP62628.1 Uncharacterised protein [Bordetella pertussis]
MATGAVTPGQAVDSSATVMAPGHWTPTAALSSRRKSMASRFSRLPWRLGIHWPAGRL